MTLDRTSGSRPYDNRTGGNLQTGSLGGPSYGPIENPASQPVRVLWVLIISGNWRFSNNNYRNPAGWDAPWDSDDYWCR